MLAESRCFSRQCRFYLGILQPNETEEGEINYCDAFPEGIPEEIAYGQNNHESPLEGQKNDIIYERETK